MNPEIMDDGTAFLSNFQQLPRRYAGKEIQIEFTHESSFHPANEDACRALDLPLGDTIVDYLPIEPGGISFPIYASGEIAERFLTLRAATTVNAKARTLFGTYVRGDDPTGREDAYQGLHVVEIVDAGA